MDREAVIAVLRACKRDLHETGVISLSLFGSVARGEATAHDVDVAVRLSPAFCKPGLDYFRRLDDLESRLSDLLGCHVDVIEEPVRSPRFQHEIDRDRAVAF